MATLSETRASELLAPLLGRFESRRPIRAGSLIVTLYGDAILPRGGSLWLGSLNALVAPFGIEPGLVRTAMSRLVTEGWFERNRVGKSSFYRLSSRGNDEFRAASHHIYSARTAEWSGQLELAILASGDAKERQAWRDGLARVGFGQLAANVMMRPQRVAGSSRDPARHADEIRLVATPEDAVRAATLGGACWNLEELSASYRSLLEDLTGLSRAVGQLEEIDEARAFQLRVLLAHEWRRIVLRDPLLPQAMLPAGWPGTRAREAVGAIYLSVRDAAERWLDARAENESGRLPAAGAHLLTRFR